jgi:hypothetical protein
MPQVINVLTGRRINEENARVSDFHGGYIHSNVAMRVAKSIRVVNENWSSVDVTYDFMARAEVQANTTIVNTFNANGNLTPISLINGALVENGTKYTDLTGNVYYFPTLHSAVITYNGQRLPDWAVQSARKVLVNGSTSGGIQSYREWTESGQVRNSVQWGEHYKFFKYEGVEVYSNRLQNITINGEESAVTMFDYRSWDNAVNSTTRGNIFGYHASSRYRMSFDATIETGKWYFGIEAEKQDSNARAYASYLGGKCDGWGAERDSSLGSGGVEFISPILPLHNGTLVRKNFQKHRWMLDAKLDDNGNASRTSCGGHITISKGGMNGRDLLNHLHHFVPFFYSLYIGRLNTGYGGAVTKGDVSHTRRAFNLKPFGVEIRIFSGVPNMEGAWWRVQLLQVIADMIDSGEVQSYKDVANALVTDKHPLRKIMRKMYDSKRIRDKFALVLAFGNMYENGNGDIDITGTSDEVKHKQDRVVTAFNQFQEVRRCASRVWGVNSISVSS